MITSVVTEPKEEGRGEQKCRVSGVEFPSTELRSFFFPLERQSITILKIIRYLRERKWGVTVWLQSFSSEGTNSSGDG